MIVVNERTIIIAIFLLGFVFGISIAILFYQLNQVQSQLEQVENNLVQTNRLQNDTNSELNNINQQLIGITEKMPRMQQTLLQIEDTMPQLKQDYLVKVDIDKKYSGEAVYCLAKNIFHEAGIESERGKYAVGQVTLNRVAVDRWGDTICEVVYSDKQFSWTNHKKLIKEKPTGDLWLKSLDVAQNMLNNDVRYYDLQTALFYHRYDISPKWINEKSFIEKIGAHLFYKSAKNDQLALNERY